MKKFSKSELPVDFTPTTGSNYGLDGFDFDEKYNEGVLDRARLPETRGLSKLPDGLIGTGKKKADLPRVVEKSLEEGIDLSPLLSKNAGLVSLEWLDFVEPDPERLPVNPVDRSIPELEKAWGVHERTTGVVSNIDPNYVEKSKPKKKSNVNYLDIAQQAMRSSAFGESLENIYRQARLRLGTEDPSPLISVFNKVKEEHGLVGNVFVRASAFPNCHKGIWNDNVRKNASESEFLLKKASCGSCIFAEKGRCTVLKKKLVASIPWDKALEIYGPKLSSQGKKLASSGSSKEILKKAFLSDSVNKIKESYKPLVVPEADKISAEQARKELARFSKERVVVKSEDLEKKAFLNKVKDQIENWVKLGYLDPEKSLELLAIQDKPATLLKRAYSIVTKSLRSKKYKGAGEHALPQYDISLGEAVYNLKNLENESNSKKQAKFNSALEKNISSKISHMVSSNMLTKEEASKILSLSKGKSFDETMKLATSLISKKFGTKTSKKVENPVLEFGLDNNSLSNFNYYGQAEKKEKLSSFDFGGMQIDLEEK